MELAGAAEDKAAQCACAPKRRASRASRQGSQGRGWLPVSGIGGALIYALQGVDRGAIPRN